VSVGSGAGFEAAAGVAGPPEVGVAAPGIVTIGDGTFDMKSSGELALAPEGACLVVAGPGVTPQVVERDDHGGEVIVGMMGVDMCTDLF
jgi:hypothetical protein